jgi:elongation factor P
MQALTRFCLRGAKVEAIALRIGYVIEKDARLYSVTKKTFNRTAQRAATIQLELRDLKTGMKTTDRLRTSDTVERVLMDSKRMQYLYATDTAIVLMDPDSYDQVEVSRDLVSEDQFKFLADGMQVTMESTSGAPTAVMLPDTVVATVAQTDKTIKGAQQNPTYKTAVLDNGVKISVPPFIEEGDRVVVRTEDLEYMGREKQ